MKTTGSPTSFLALVLFWASTTSGFGQASAGISANDEKVAKVDQLMSTFAEYGQFNGAVLVAEKGKVLYKKGFGMANMEWDVLLRDLKSDVQ